MGHSKRNALGIEMCKLMLNSQVNQSATQLFNGAAKFDLQELSIARFWAFPGDAYSLGLRLVQA